MRGKGPLRLIRGRKPPCYEADDRLTPDEQGPEADKGKKRALRLMREEKAPVSVA